MITLTTERLILRNWEITDVDDFFEYAQSPEVGPNAGWEPHKTIEDSMNILNMFLEKNEVWAIVYKENNKVIGSIGLHEDGKRESINAKMLGYVLSPEYWGKGLMTEAANKVIKHAFEEVEVDLLSCYHYSFNKRSKRVIEKCGFKFEGTLRKACKNYNGDICDDCCYSITREEYEKRKIGE